MGLVMMAFHVPVHGLVIVRMIAIYFTYDSLVSRLFHFVYIIDEEFNKSKFQQ